MTRRCRAAERSRQLKELIFSREVNAIEDYEKQKEVKSFVAIGQPLMEQRVIDATIAARADHADQSERRRALACSARDCFGSFGERVLVSRRPSRHAQHVVVDLALLLDPYLNETWAKREAVLGKFNQGVRIATIRNRVDRRIKQPHGVARCARASRWRTRPPCASSSSGAPRAPARPGGRARATRAARGRRRYVGPGGR